ncbi:hypothetical protein B0G57_111163 [Trinickia symbiotica]|nr:hypothetical protein B0G57_111163 [Trinickia symbiotica]
MEGDSLIVDAGLLPSGKSTRIVRAARLPASQQPIEYHVRGCVDA